jgi:hypothetical protein
MLENYSVMLMRQSEMNSDWRLRISNRRTLWAKDLIGPFSVCMFKQVLWCWTYQYHSVSKYYPITYLIIEFNIQILPNTTCKCFSIGSWWDFTDFIYEYVTQSHISERTFRFCKIESLWSYKWIVRRYFRIFPV